MQTTKTQRELHSDHPPLPESPVTYPPVIHLIRAGFQLGGRLAPDAAARQAYRLFATPRIRARHRQSDPLLESAELFEFLYGKLLLKGYRWGRGQRTALLVHGWESRGTALRHFVPGLVEAGYQVVAFDGPAHGHSPGKQTNIVHFAGAIQALWKHIGGADALIAHSFGGAASSVALSRLEQPLAKLVCVAVPDSMKRVLLEACDILGVPKPARKRFLRLMEERLDIPVQKAYTHQFGLKGRIGEALIVHDRQDNSVPFSEGQSLFEQWPFAELLSSDGYGHFQLMKNPDVQQLVADFVARS